MAIPTSATWNIADFNAATMQLLLGLGPADLSLIPGAAPYFTYSADTLLLTMASEDGVTAFADFNVAMPSLFTVDFVVRMPRLPHDIADIASHHVGIQLGDDAGRGVAIYFASTGVAVARLDDFGSVSSLPDSTTFTAEIARYFHRVRVAVNSALGRAYVFIGRETDPFPPLRFIVPVEATPPGVGDRFRLVVRGTGAQPAQIELKTLQLAGALLLPNIPPTANAGSDRVISSGNSARLDGRASFDPEGAPLSYFWRAIDAPFGSTFAHDASDGSTTDDGDADGVTPLLTFPPSTLPAWVAAGDVLLIASTRHDIATVNNVGGQLTVSTDTIPDNLSGVPFRIIRQSLLVGATEETATVVPDVPGLYRFGLVVNDGEIDSEESEVLVSVVGARAPLGIEPEVEVIWNAMGDEWRLVQGREVFTEFWRGTTQILGARLLEVWQHHYNMSLGDAQRVFQRKWVAFRTTIDETAPASATIAPRYGKLEGTYNFSLGDPPVTGATLVVEIPAVDGTFTPYVVTFTGDTPAQIAADVSAALVGLGIDPYFAVDGPRTYFGLTSTTTAFRLGITSSAALVLGLTTSRYNYLSGVRGSRVTDNTYRVDTAVDLVAQGVRYGDLLVLNNGQAFRIDRVLDDPRDPGPNQRLLLRDALPFDATVEWEIPGVVRSTEVNYELAGSYPGDLVKVETYDPRNGAFADTNSYVVAQHTTTVAAHLDGLFAYLADPTYELRLLGVKRRKGVAIPEEVVSIPRLQDLIPKRQYIEGGTTATPQTFWLENIDYILEPFFRDDLEQPIPQIQFRDSVFIEPDIEPPDIFWAELVLFNNDANIEDLFGRLAGFLRVNAASFGSGFSYLSGVSGLMYAMQRGPTPHAMRVGTQILFGQPFAEVAGYITEIRDDYSPESSRILIQDDDGNVPSTSEIIRSYIYRKDPLDLSPTSGLEVNPATGVPYVVGDRIEQFAPIGAGVNIEDYVNRVDWFVPFVRSGLLSELEKFFYFVVRFNLDLVSLANLLLIFQFLYRIKPTYTHPLLLGSKVLIDDLDPIDTLSGTIRMRLYDSICGEGRAWMYDDYRGDGTFWTHFDGIGPPWGPVPDPDGLARFDGYIDCPEDWIQFCLRIVWPGGVITHDSIFFLDTDVVDVLGTFAGPPGTLFTPTYDMVLPAGTYEVCPIIDPGSTL